MTEGATRHGSVLLEAGFRPFFLLAGAYGAAAMVPWLVLLGGGHTFAVEGGPLTFHAHEMVFGVTLAAVGGFLLTAVPSWTDTPRLRGGPLAALVLAWLLGRIAFWSSAALGPRWVAALDLLYVPGLALAVLPPIVRRRNRRNYVFVPLLALLFVADAITHLGLLGGLAGGARLGAKMGAYVEVFVVAVIGGRIVPAFTANALRKAGDSIGIPARPRVQAFALTLVAAALTADLVAEGSTVSALLALGAGLALTARLVSFRGAHVVHRPIVLVLHVGYAFVCAGLFALGASALGGRLGPSTALHVFTAGALGTMMLAVMSRAALGHTGRSLVASRPVILAYALVAVGAVVRVTAPLLATSFRPRPLVVAGTLWALGYLLFTVVYAPVLLGPRVDGKPG